MDAQNIGQFYEGVTHESSTYKYTNVTTDNPLWASEEWVSFMSGLAFWFIVIVLCSVCFRSLCRSVLCEMPCDILADCKRRCSCLGDCWDIFEYDGDDAECNSITTVAGDDDSPYEEYDLEGIGDDPPHYDLALHMPKPSYSEACLISANSSTYFVENELSARNPAFHISDSSLSLQQSLANEEQEEVDNNDRSHQQDNCEHAQFRQRLQQGCLMRRVDTHRRDLVERVNQAQVSHINVRRASLQGSLDTTFSCENDEQTSIVIESEDDELPSYEQAISIIHNEYTRIV